jgi:hypothetical protein
MRNVTYIMQDFRGNQALNNMSIYAVSLHSSGTENNLEFL